MGRGAGYRVVLPILPFDSQAKKLTAYTLKAVFYLKWVDGLLLPIAKSTGSVVPDPGCASESSGP